MNESLLTLTRQLAESLATDEGALTLARMQRLALAASRRPAPERPDSGLRLGIWDPVAREDGTIEFARASETSGEWRYWADVERIPQKNGPRVVLVGESVARAYLFDPAVTLASMLSRSLGVEVVDLARTDLVAPQLPPIFDALPALEPDAVVLFAGNNWSTILLELENLELLARAIREGGFAWCRTVFVQRLIRGRARATLEAIAARLENTPLCIVVPEFNLLDWRSEPTITVPVIADVKGWLERAAEGRAGEMIALDGGASPVSQQMAAGQAIARGDLNEARRRLEAARDAQCGLMVAHSPRCCAVVQEELRAAARQYGFALVDLPNLFWPLPDRQLFLDYCHLTGEGLVTVTTAIGRALRDVLQVEPSAPDAPAVGVSARAHLLAAIHNAHYGQPAEIVGYHMARAVALDPAVSEMAAALAELVCRRAESWMCDAWEAFREEPQARRYLGAPEMLRAPRMADLVLAEAAADAAGQAALVDRLLIEEALPAPLDLLAPRHRAATIREAIGHGLGPPLGFVRATAPVSRFVVFRAAADPLTARLTLRAAGDVIVVVNGERVAALPADARWKKFEVPLALGRGRNTIELAWPAPQVDATVEFERAARRLERGLYPEVLAAFGELYSFTAG